MRQIWITKPGDVDVLEIREAPDPEPGEGEVRVAVKGVGINFADLMARRGMYQDAPKIPCVVGYDIAGIVDAVGPGATRFKEGDHVFGLSRFGGYATHVCVSEQQLYPVPSGLDFADAAAIPVNYFTAYLALFFMGNLKDGERLLVHGAGGGVGMAALQLAQQRSVEVFGTASASKHEILRVSGCDHTIDYRTKDFVKEIERQTEGEGVHLVLDPLGGKSVKRDYQVLAPMGRIVAYGIAAGVRGRKRNLVRLIRTALSFPSFGMIELMNRNQGVFGLNLGHLWGEIPRLRWVGDEIIRLIEEGAIEPRAGHRFAFDDVQQAHRFMDERHNIGKVVLVV